MRLSVFLSLACLLPLLSVSRGEDVALDAKSDLAANAAMQYWQAFSRLPTLDKDEEKLLADWATIPLDAAAQKLIDSSQSSMLYLRRGAALPRCDWCLEYNAAMGLPLPQLWKARDVARFASLHVRKELERGDKKSAQTDARAIMVLGRHARRDPILVSILVGFSLENMAVDVVAPYVPEL